MTPLGEPLDEAVRDSYQHIFQGGLGQPHANAVYDLGLPALA